MDKAVLERAAALALDETCRAGADLADVSVSAGISRQVEARDNKVAAVFAHRAREVTIRAVVGRRIGFYRLHSLSDGDIRTGARFAVDVAGSAEPDPDFHDLPHPSGDVRVPADLYDPAVEDLDLARLRSWTDENIQSAVEKAHNARISGTTGVYVNRGVVWNSNGVKAYDEGSLVSLDFFAVVRDGDEAGSYFAFSEGRLLKDVSPSGVAERAAAQAAGFLGARDMPSGRYPVVLAPLASYDFFRRLAHAANAEEHQRNRSYLSGRVGEEIAPVFFNLRDDPLVGGGIYSGAYDGEGAVREQVQLIESGRLAGLLHSSYTAGKAGCENNGHGGRTGSVHPTNLRPSLGSTAGDDIVGSVDDGILLLAGSLDPNSVTGEISTLLDFAYRIENGTVAYPLRNVTVVDRMTDVIGAITEVSSDYEILPGNPMPHVLLDNIKIVGSA
ncbi:MAG: TldD/PmbA family protein [Planctomycetes bacterium]|nr:TldD/PmbA family protein [Planctomycetota bacterium]